MSGIWSRGRGARGQPHGRSVAEATQIALLGTAWPRRGVNMVQTPRVAVS